MTILLEISGIIIGACAPAMHMPTIKFSAWQKEKTTLKKIIGSVVVLSLLWTNLLHAGDYGYINFTPPSRFARLQNKEFKKVAQIKFAAHQALKEIKLFGLKSIRNLGIRHIVENTIFSEKITGEILFNTAWTHRKPNPTLVPAESDSYIVRTRVEDDIYWCLISKGASGMACQVSVVPDNVLNRIRSETEKEDTTFESAHESAGRRDRKVIIMDDYVNLETWQARAAGAVNLEQIDPENLPLLSPDQLSLLEPEKLHRIRLRRRSSLSMHKTMVKLFKKNDYNFQRRKDDLYEQEKQAFEIYIPKGFNPQRSYGVIVWIGAGERGFPYGKYDDWLPVLDKHSLIWIGANNAGNIHSVYKRFGLALTGCSNIMHGFKECIDKRRVYIAGFSGGGRCVSMMMLLYPWLFKGGFYFSGCNAPRKMEKNLMEEAKKNRHVFLAGTKDLETGEEDFNRQDTEDVFDTYERLGFTNITHIEVPDMGHWLPPAMWFEKGIEALDAPLKAGAIDAPLKAGGNRFEEPEGLEIQGIAAKIKERNIEIFIPNRQIANRNIRNCKRVLKRTFEDKVRIYYKLEDITRMIKDPQKAIVMTAELTNEQIGYLKEMNAALKEVRFMNFENNAWLKNMPDEQYENYLAETLGILLIARTITEEESKDEGSPMYRMFAHLLERYMPGAKKSDMRKYIRGIADSSIELFDKLRGLIKNILRAVPPKAYRTLRYAIQVLWSA